MDQGHLKIWVNSGPTPDQQRIRPLPTNTKPFLLKASHVHVEGGLEELRKKDGRRHSDRQLEGGHRRKPAGAYQPF